MEEDYRCPVLQLGAARITQGASVNIHIPANHPDLIGIVPILEFQNLKKKNRDIPIFKRKNFFFVKIWNWVVKDWS